MSMKVVVQSDGKIFTLDLSGASFTSTQDPQGNITISVDKLEANIIPRQGTTASLMSLTAPKGEIATALNATGKPEGIVQFGQISQDNKFYSPIPAGFINEYGWISPSAELVTYQPIRFKSGVTNVQNYEINFSERRTAVGVDGTSITMAAQSADAGRGGDFQLQCGMSAVGQESGVYLGSDSAAAYLGVAELNVDGTTLVGKIGMFDKAFTPTEQPTNTAGGTMVANTGTAVLAGSTFTGGIGTSGYTIGQVVRALKLLGLIAD